MNNGIYQLRKELSSNLESTFTKFKQNGVVIWGTGSSGLAFKRFLEDFDALDALKCFCDSYTKDNSNKVLSEVKVCSPHETYRQYPKAIYVIASSHRREILKFIKDDPILHSIQTFYYNSNPDSCEYQAFIYATIYLRDVVHQDSYVCNYLKFFDYFSADSSTDKINFETKEVLDLFDDEISKTVLKNRIDFFSTGHLSCLKNIPIEQSPYEYFDFFDFKLGSNEVFVDCGAFTGDSISSFIDVVNGKYKSVLAFEPDTKNYKILLNNVDKLKWKNIECVKAATGLIHSYVNFSDDGGAGAALADSKKDSDNVQHDLTLQIKLDEYIDRQPTLIKMDIEGAELDCLKGAEKLIKTLKPKLAICLYHKPMDLFTIPLYLKSIVPQYRFKLRQHHHPIFDTVLYAF
ncbi:MAG: FkbM family methyltransferase [Succinivibrio sp.]|nr:FkbM family methyltransferase [Succinivibrio sp.]